MSLSSSLHGYTHRGEDGWRVKAPEEGGGKVEKVVEEMEMEKVEERTTLDFGRPT